MFAKLWKDVRSPRLWRREREEMAVRLTEMAEEEGVLVLDDDMMAKLGSRRRLILRAACDVALAEKAQLRSGSSGQLELVSNEAFKQIVMEALFGNESAATPTLPVPHPSFLVGSASPDDDFGSNAGEILPFGRQNLPDRKREPWVALENAVYDEEVKK